jgi:hypothetical protein
MKENNKSCQHDFKIESSKRISICTLCGVLKVDKIVWNKPISAEKACEFDKFKILNNFKHQKAFEETNPNYLKRRSCIVKYLRKFIDTCSYSEETFYQCLYLVDTILTKQSNPFERKYDLCVIGCLLLSGKIFLI